MSLLEVFKHLQGQHDQSRHATKNNSLTKEEKASVRTYTSGQYHTKINAILRGKAGSPEDNKLIQNIASAIDKSSIEEDTILYRAFRSPRTDEEMLSIWGRNRIAREGEIVENKGFSSTSSNQRIARRYGRKYGGVSEEESLNLFRIKVKKGQKGLKIDSDELGDNPEGEVLLQKGSKFKILERDYHEPSDTHIFDVELLD